jgi:hypothetical protein
MRAAASHPFDNAHSLCLGIFHRSEISERAGHHNKGTLTS